VYVCLAGPGWDKGMQRERSRGSHSVAWQHWAFRVIVLLVWAIFGQPDVDADPIEEPIEDILMDKMRAMTNPAQKKKATGRSTSRNALNNAPALVVGVGPRAPCFTGDIRHHPRRDDSVDGILGASPRKYVIDTGVARLRRC